VEERSAAHAACPNLLEREKRYFRIAQLGGSAVQSEATLQKFATFHLQYDFLNFRYMMAVRASRVLHGLSRFNAVTAFPPPEPAFLTH
jgi:hypothetical protein